MTRPAGKGFLRALAASRTEPGWVAMEPARGFAAPHRRLLRDPATPEVLADMLGLIGYSVTPARVRRWPLGKRAEAELYATRVHLKASDNPVRVPPRPWWLPDPWLGKRGARGNVAGGTVLR